MRYKGEKAMKRVVLAAVAALFLTIACANSEQSVVLEKFIPWSEVENCKVEVESKYWFTRGVMDIYFTANYRLFFKVVNYMAVSSQTGETNPEQPIDIHEANRWKLEYMNLEYELPPVPGINANAWAPRKVRQDAVLDPEGGKAAGHVELLTNEQWNNLVQIFETLMTAGVSFDWETYPLIVTLQAEGRKLGGGDLIRTNKLSFNLVPIYGESVMSGALYPVDATWPTDEELAEQNLLEADFEQAKYERDKEIYEVIMEYCDFPTEHLVGGCYPGMDGGLVDCYTWEGGGDYVKALYPGYECCPKKQPDEPEEPETATP